MDDHFKAFGDSLAINRNLYALRTHRDKPPFNSQSQRMNTLEMQVKETQNMIWVLQCALDELWKLLQPTYGVATR